MSCKVVMLTPVISSSFVIFMGCDIYIFVTGVNDDGTNHTFSQCNLGGWASARSADRTAAHTQQSVRPHRHVFELLAIVVVVAECDAHVRHPDVQC